MRGLLCQICFLNNIKHFLLIGAWYYRSGENPRKKGGRVRESSNQKKDGGLGRKLLESSWLLRGNKSKEERKVCAVCLEDLGEEQHVMNLSCSHKYHSACLLPWLATHPHCPYCRTPVLWSHTVIIDEGQDKIWITFYYLFYRIFALCCNEII